MQRRYYEKQLSKHFWASKAPVTVVLRFYSSLGQVVLTSLYQIGEFMSSIFDAKFHIIATRFHISVESVSGEVE